MLESALKFQKAFERLDEIEPHFASDLKDGVPIERDWKNARVLTKFLKHFFDATKRLSGSLYVTSNHCFQEVCAIEQILCDWAKNSDPCLSVMAMKMKEKFDKYWGNIDKMNMMLVVAVVLDPRYKLKYVKYCYNLIYASDKVNDLVRRVRELMNRMYVHYQMLDSTSTITPNKMSEGSNEMVVDQPHEPVKSLDQGFLKHLEEEESIDSKSEVDKYLEESVEKNRDNFEILNWWKLNSSRYRILSQIARDVLAIPVSTVASESAFSTGGRILDQFRSSLTPKLVECLICTQDWLRASSVPIEVEERLDELEEFESVITEDHQVSEGTSTASIIRSSSSAI